MPKRGKKYQEAVASLSTDRNYMMLRKLLDLVVKAAPSKV